MSTDQKTIDWYNANAQSYTQHVRDPKDSVYHSLYEKPAIYVLLPDLSNLNVISIGCGSGEDSHHLKELGAKRSVGIDISQELIAIAQKSYPDCEFKAMDMESLDFPDQSFDFAYSSLALHYLETWETTLKEVHRILRPGSSFLFSCQHPVNSLFEYETKDGIKTQLFGRIRDTNKGTLKIIGNYMDRRKIVGYSAMAVNAWHKSIGEIAGEISRSKFLISDIVEPRPLPEMQALEPDDYQTLLKIPSFLIFKLLKPTH